MKSSELAEKIAHLILEKKGEDILIMDMRCLTTITDFFVLCSVDSDVQARSVLDLLTEKLSDDAVKPWHVEGSVGSNWVLLDFVDVVVHIFKPETRAFYGLERLWGDAQFIEVKDL